MEGIGDGAGRGGKVAKGIVCVGLGQYPGSIGQRRDGAQPVRFVEIGRSPAQHCQWFVDVEALRVVGDNGARGVHFLDEVVAIVEVNAGPWRGLLDAAPERIVLEGALAAQRRRETGGEEARLEVRGKWWG